MWTSTWIKNILNATSQTPAIHPCDRLYTTWHCHPQEENSHTNEKREIYAKPLLTFIVIWVEQIWYTPKGKSLLSKAAQKIMTDSWMVSVKQLSDTMFSLNRSQSKHSMSSCLTKMFLYSQKLAGCLYLSTYLLQTKCGTL